MNTPVVLIVFNRPELTRRVLDRIRSAQPARLFVIGDGPRPDRPDDTVLVAQVRALLDTEINWPCEVFRNESAENLGCMDRIRTGLDWAFEQTDRAIVLEDDCLPDPTFFSFCDDLLSRYQDDERIMHISGTSLVARHYSPRFSYWFSHHPWTWGWASWRRAWQHNDYEMNTWNSRRAAVEASFSSRFERQFWISTFEEAYRDLRAANCWDFQWNFTCRSLGGLSIIPRENLVENIGFQSQATHAFGDTSRLAVPVGSIGQLVHPPSLQLDPYADDLWSRIYSGSTPTLWRNLKAVLRILRERIGRSAPALHAFA